VVPGPLLTACRGCCCGTDRKHPDVDHAALLARLVEAVGEHGRVRTSECLGPCKQSDVVVVAPTREARRAGARPVWLRTVLSAATVDGIAAWVAAGGPGVAEPPLEVEILVFDPVSRTDEGVEATEATEPTVG
jgi:(2Fe-2S) ferredoxin